jgi:hypothetical protein
MLLTGGQIKGRSLRLWYCSTTRIISSWFESSSVENENFLRSIVTRTIFGVSGDKFAVQCVHSLDEALNISSLCQTLTPTSFTKYYLYQESSYFTSFWGFCRLYYFL